MTTPQERLSRMRKSFEKDRSVLAGDYEFFTTPNAPVMPHESIPRNKAAHRSAERSAQKSLKPS
jgi:hypothetical protein